MTTWTLEAKAVSVSTDSNVLTIGFADDASHPGKYLLLQRELSFSEQDHTLKQDTYYVELSGQDTSFYGGIADYALGSDRLELGILPGNEHTKLEKIVILRGVDVSAWATLDEGLQRLFEGTDVRATMRE